MIQSPKAEQGIPYFVTLTVRDWADVFIRNEYRDLIVDSLKFCQQNKGLHVFAYCLMTSHLHMVAASSTMTLDKVLAHLKSYTGTALLDAISENPGESRREWFDSHFRQMARLKQLNQERAFWQPNNYPIEIKGAKSFRSIEKYIHENPMKAGFVLAPEMWLHSSACPDCPLPIMAWG